MASDYWIKLYHEILDDPKMAILPDHLWRRIIEIFLIAGRHNKGGELPTVGQMAWLLRCNDTASLERDINAIIEIGIIEQIGDVLSVTNFKKRQDAATPAERMAQHRDRKHKQEYYGDVTERLRSVTQRTDTDNRSDNRTDTDTEADSGAPDSFALVLSVIERVTGLPGGPSSTKAINDLVEADVTEDDIRAGYQWLIDNERVVRYYSQLVGPAKTAQAKRLQTANGGSNGNGHKATRIVVSPSGETMEVAA